MIDPELGLGQSTCVPVCDLEIIFPRRIQRVLLMTFRSLAHSKKRLLSFAVCLGSSLVCVVIVVVACVVQIDCIFKRFVHTGPFTVQNRRNLGIQCLSRHWKKNNVLHLVFTRVATGWLEPIVEACQWSWDKYSPCIY